MGKNSLYDMKLIEESYHPKVVAYYFKEWKDYNMSIHRHDQVEIMYVLKGKCIIDTVDFKHTLTKGDCILLDANCPHNLYVEIGKPCRMLNVEFGFEKTCSEAYAMKGLIQSTQSLKSIIEAQKLYIVVKDTDEIHDLLKNLIRELDENGTDSEFVERLLIYQILINISRRMEETANEENITTSTYIKKAIRYMNDNFSKDIMVEDIASFVNLHTNYLHRIFKEFTGQTPIDYLQGIRVKKAEMLLIHTDIPIIDIAGDLGFGSRQYFSFVFKKYTNLSPLKFRNEHSEIYWRNDAEEEDEMDDMQS